MKDDYIMLDDSMYNRIEEEVLREMLGDEGYEEMMAQIKAEQEEERHMSRRQLRKKRAAQRRQAEEARLRENSQEAPGHS